MTDRTTHSATAAALFAGPGEMRALCRAFDWASTPLGPVEKWPRSLRTTAGIVLGSRNPMFLFWGPELVQLYNDAYRPSLGGGGRHPRALGMRGRDLRREASPRDRPHATAVDEASRPSSPSSHTRSHDGCRASRR